MIVDLVWPAVPHARYGEDSGLADGGGGNPKLDCEPVIEPLIEIFEWQIAVDSSTLFFDRD